MAARTVADEILEKVKAMQQDIEDIKQQIGEDGMEPVDKRLRRIETKIHAMADGTFSQQSDGMDQQARADR